MITYLMWIFVTLNALGIFLMVYGISNGWIDKQKD